MNAVEIEEAVSELAAAPFDGAEFPFAFLTAFGNKETTVKRLRTASSNTSDVAEGVLQRNNIHLAVCAEGRVGEPKLPAGRRLCSSSPEVGDTVLVLGYPLSARAGLLVFDGIIAADDAPDGYWTSANNGGASGGMVIDATDDCYLGMTVSGGDGALADLGRVLKWQEFAPSEK